MRGLPDFLPLFVQVVATANLGIYKRDIRHYGAKRMTFITILVTKYVALLGGGPFSIQLGT